MKEKDDDGDVDVGGDEGDTAYVKVKHNLAHSIPVRLSSNLHC